MSRTIEEIKADIKYCSRPGSGVSMVDMAHLHNELRAALTASIPLDRLDELCAAERDNRCVVLPSRQDEIVHAVNVALHIDLYDWQIAYIFGASDYLMPGRRTGRTLAYVLRLLLSEGDPINMRDRRSAERICDENHGSQYVDWFRNFLHDVYHRLSNPGLGLKLRKVYFDRAAADAALHDTGRDGEGLE